ALYDIGIETGNWKDKGQLVIDEDKLRAAIEKDADGIAKLFTSKDGLATKMNSILDQTAKKSSASPGSLVTLAGAVGTAKEKENDLSKRMEAINKQITSLKRSYELEKARYWKQFNAMEQVVSNSSSQSSWLSQM
ncbi:MAG: flagellar filament capping protein FliD, partial [Oscillospiraceae bacterium]